VPYCGAFPMLDGEGKPPTSSRLLVLSKTALATTLRCQRRAAWKHLHHLPEDDAPEEADNHGAGPGSAAHELLAELVLAPDPDAAMAELLDIVSPVDRAFAEEMALRHLRLEASTSGHPIVYRRSEVTAGVCFDMRDVVDTPTVVAVLARLDAIGRDSEGTPVVVEHKTGRSAIEVEADLYAVVGWHLARRRDSPPGLAVHHHWLGTGQDASCEQSAYSPDEIAAATIRIRSIAAVAATWDPADASSPPPRAEYDSYCAACPYERRCRRHGGPTPSASSDPMGATAHRDRIER
ncbi:MAG: PD-(D/E)XK nuclease family protein, partial [Ilumatobacteraceae bacterium]